MSESHDHRARSLIERLELVPHPEGGYYREIFRSTSRVKPDDERPVRSAATTIYFLLAAEQHSRWHRVRSDEIWHFHEGDPLELFLASPEIDRFQSVVLDRGNPVRVVRAGWWQAARPIGSYSLTACTVAPGFEFADFTLLRDDAAGLAALERLDPSTIALV